MTEEEKRKAIEELCRANPLLAQLMQIGKEGLSTFVADLENEGLNGTINGMPFGRKQNSK